MNEINNLILSDYYRYYGKKCSILSLYFLGISGYNHCFSYSFWLRLSSKKNFFWLLAKYMHRRLSLKYGIRIPSKTKIGYGFYIGHGVGTIVNHSTIIGNNCNISQFTTIGSNKGKAAEIGDNVYIGPSVCLVENVKIGNNVSIGAGSVVLKDIPENVTVAGVPATAINAKIKPGQFVNNRWEY